MMAWGTDVPWIVAASKSLGGGGETKHVSTDNKENMRMLEVFYRSLVCGKSVRIFCSIYILREALPP